MNSIILIKKLLDEKSNIELISYLSSIWDRVWFGNSEFCYANLRLFKTSDKIKNISDMGVNFKNKYVLDIGCGNGATLLFLRKYFDIKGIGLDISNRVIKESKKILKMQAFLFTLGITGIYK